MDDIRPGDSPSTSIPHDEITPESESEEKQETLRRRTPWDTVEGRVLSLISRKGGVGKTTSAVNLGAALALNGHSVLVIGTDPQCGVCRTLGARPEDLPTSLDEVFTGRVPLTSLAQPSPLENLFFVSPRITTLAEEETYLDHLSENIDDFVREVDRARNLFDTILIDCPPSLGPATRAALLACDGYLVPVQAEELCRTTLEPLLEFVGTFRDRNFQAAQDSDAGIHPPLLEGMFLTMASGRTRMGRHVAAQVSEDFGDFLMESGIPRTTRLSEMALKGKPAVIYDRRSAGSRAYFDLADELVKRYSRSAAELEESVPDQPAPTPEPGKQRPRRAALRRAMSTTAWRDSDVSWLIWADPPRPPRGFPPSMSPLCPRWSLWTICWPRRSSAQAHRATRTRTAGPTILTPVTH